MFYNQLFRFSNLVLIIGAALWISPVILADDLVVAPPAGTPPQAAPPAAAQSATQAAPQTEPVIDPGASAPSPPPVEPIKERGLSNTTAGAGPKPPTSTYVYQPSLWNCHCANFPKKSCDNGFAFSSMITAVQYAKEKCGSDCTPDCTSKNASQADIDRLGKVDADH